MKVDYYDAKGEINVQIDQMKEAINKGVKTIVLLAVDGTLIMPTVELAVNEGVTIITVNRDIKECEHFEVTSIEYEAGILQAEYLSKTLPFNAKIVYLMGMGNQRSSVQRWEGFRNEISDRRPDIEILDMQDGSYIRTEAMKIMSLWLKLYPKIDAVVCGNDQMAFGAIAAMKAVNRLEGCQVVGVDAVEEAIEAIKNGEIVMTVKQDAAAQAAGAVELAVLSENYQDLINIILPFQVVTKDNLSEVK